MSHGNIIINYGLGVGNLGLVCGCNPSTIKLLILFGKEYSLDPNKSSYSNKLACGRKVRH